MLNASFKTIGKILLAPIAEEIFFRGFLEDRLEDIIELANQHFHRLSSENKTLLRQALSATLFGALHITGNQVEGIAMKALVFISVTFMGYELSLAKERHRSLLASMMVHASQNLSCIIGMAKYGLQIAAGNAIYNFFGR